MPPIHAAHSIPAAYRKARRSGAPQGGPPRVVTSLSTGYGAFGATRQRNPPTDLELLGAYRNATYVCASYKAEAVASQPLRLYATTTRSKGHKDPRCKVKSL